MVFQEGRNVKYIFDEVVSQELDIKIERSLLDDQWEFIDFIYFKSIDVVPVTITLYLELKEGGPLFKLREVVNFSGNHFYFQINKEMPKDWTINLKTLGAAGSGAIQRAALFWR